MINLVCLGWFSFCLWSLDEENNRTIMWEGWRGRAEEEEQVVIMMNEMMAHWPSNAAASLPVGVSCPTTTVRPCLIHTHTQPFFLCLTHQAFLLSLTSHPFLLLVLPSVLSLAPVVPALHVMTTDRNKAPLVEFAKNCSSLEIRDKHGETMNRSQQRQKEFMMRKTKIKPGGEGRC